MRRVELAQPDLYFSECFKVSPKKLDTYGAFDISVVSDLPLFIDPFLLFNSEKPEYQARNPPVWRRCSIAFTGKTGLEESNGLQVHERHPVFGEA